MKGIKVCSNEWPHPFPNGNKKSSQHIKISRAWPTSTKLGKKHPFVMEIKVCSYEGPCCFPKGNIRKFRFVEMKGHALIPKGDNNVKLEIH